MQRKQQKLIVVVGPTGSGKSALAVRMARKFNGEIISADSRQVYRGLDIGTAKITKAQMRGIPHHLLDIASPRQQFSAAEFVARAKIAIADIAGRGKIPIIAGGTAFWINALVYDFQLPEVAPDKKLRARLEGKTPTQLLAILKKLDPRRAAGIEQKNPRRLARAIEIAQVLGTVPKLEKKSPYDTLWIGIRPPAQKLKHRIWERAARMARADCLPREIRTLLARRITKKRIRELGFEYGAGLDFTKGKISQKELAERIAQDTEKYALRQMRWWKKNKSIFWISNAGSKNAASYAKKFLSR